MKHLVIFDCDGVLVDSEHLANLALVESLAELEISIDLDEAIQRFKGRKMADCLLDIESTMGSALPATFETTLRQRMNRYFESRLKAVAGAEEAVQLISYAKCVASNGPLQKTKQNLEITRLARYFGENVFSAYTIQKWKPEPDLFLHACAQMDSRPNHCVVIEDSEAGVQAARAGGFRVLALGMASVADEKVIAFGSMSELPKLIDHIFALNC